MANRRLPRQAPSQFAAAIAATNAQPRFIQVERHAAPANGMPLADPLAFGLVVGAWSGAIMFGVGRLAEYVNQASATTLPGSLAIIATGAAAIWGTTWRTRLLYLLASSMDIETAEYTPPAEDKPARRHFNVDRRTVHVLSQAEEDWRDRLAWLAEEMPRRGDAFLNRDWVPLEKGFSRNEWDRLRAELVGRGWLDDSTSRLTSEGGRVMAHWRERPTSATVTDVARAMAGQPPPP
jgi:hypothetical protein